LANKRQGRVSGKVGAKAGSVVAHDRICCACACSAVFAVSVATKALAFEATPDCGSGLLFVVRQRPALSAYGDSSSKIGGAPSAPGAKKRAEINNGERPLFAVISVADQRIGRSSRS
jgi:hypothetical protein